jgi:hypothetical protein
MDMQHGHGHVAGPWTYRRDMAYRREKDMEIEMIIDIDFDIDIVKSIYKRNIFRHNNSQFRIHLIQF